jgi:uroporphyrin-III C-methyltransferase
MKPDGSAGFVSLVGAGPGDVGLLTLKAADRLRRAELVLYDALVSPEVVALAPQAHRFPVGKRAGRKSFEQRTIERLMIRAALRGKRVVRLKCGDPFVFGRGGEEALALVEAGIAFEVIPGVSSALSAPALAGIPVTHRGLASGFVVVSGHAPEAYGPVLDSLAPSSATLVVMMGVGQRAALVQRLTQRGWPRDTPAALILGASTSSQVTWVGTLENLGAAQAPEELPGTLVIGTVVSVAEQLSPRREEPRHVHG